MEVPAIPDTVGALSLDRPQFGCPICQFAGSGPFRRLDDLEVELSGRVAPAELYRAMLETYNREVEPLRQHGRDCPSLTVEQIQEHFTKHRVNVGANICSEIVYCNMLQEQLRRNEIAVRNSDGQERVCSRVLNDYLRISKHKLELIKIYKNMTPGKQDKADDYSFT